MLTTQDSRNASRKPARLVAAILFVLMVGTGYAIPPQVEGAVNLQNPVEDQDSAEAPSFASECVSGGLAFADCLLDF